MAIYSYYFISGGSFIWESDGFTQHFLLFNEYVNILQGVLRGEGFSQWDWSIGAGADTITSYGYYVIGDPFAYLGVLFPESLREFSFHLIMFIRMWCVGLSYLIFVRIFKVSHGAALLGAFMYTFSFFVIFNADRHPFFILPLIWLPLLCLGVEKILKRESALLFSIMVAVSAIANFYFFYKLTILIFIYGIVRYGMIHKFKDWKQLGSSLGRCSLHYLVGLLLGAVVFLPMVDGFLNSSRNTDGIAINLLLYHGSYYIATIHNLFVPNAYFWSAGGLSIFALFTVAFLFKTKKKKTFSGIMLLILGVFLLFPFFGSFMNGMSGPYNRFSFAIPLFLSFASGQFLEERDKLQVKDLRVVKYILIGFTFIYGIAAIAQHMYLYYVIPLVLGWLIWFILMYEKEIKKKMVNKISIVLLALVMLSMATNATNLYYSYGNDSISKTIELNTSLERYENLFGGIQNLLPEEDLYRVGVTSQDSHVRNQFIYHDLMGLSTYLSVTNGYLAEFAEEMEIASYQIIQPLRNGVDDRRITNHFLNIEYILTEEKNEAYLPYGYEVVHRSNDVPAFILAKTEANFPFAYVEDVMITRENFSKFNPVEKETFLTQGVVLETTQDVEERKIEEIANEQIKEVEYQIEYNDPELLPLDKDLVEVTESGARFKISLKNADEFAGHDIFIYLQGLEYETTDIPFYMPDDTSYNIRFLYEGRENTLRQSDKYSYSTYFYRENMFVNLGYTDVGTDDIFIQFEDTGKYHMNDITIYALPADEKIDKQIAEGKWENALDIKVFENERIEGTVQREEPGILVTTIPYEKGWKVTVNGEDREIVQANIGFIGVPLGSGNSEIVFSYQNPYLKIGSVLSLIGLLLLGLIQLIRQKRNPS
ncbi:YfhO family protein [Amphibacillus jilinensis]|uniref:YfhO family protein n=1 Tax=Amphibacillus jilinensis TaxID=1216008 RepID=UPI00035D4737|nr:YfhO family protein [Amphibacillus jilinensis]